MAQVLRACVTCKKLEGKSYRYPELSTLPNFRISRSIPFITYVGLDFFGPLTVHSAATGNNFKTYGCIFTCLVTRAIHLELMPSLTSQSLSLAVQRFMNRRGHPQFMYSDNSRTINLFQELHTSDFNWQYITPFSPWQGGVYEKLIDLVKRHIKKVLRRKILNFDELYTFFTHVESVLNTRPLTYVASTDTVDDFEILTPANLPGINNLCSFPFIQESSSQEYETVTKKDLIQFYKNHSKTINLFWTLWQNSYLPLLKERHRIASRSQNINRVPQIGDIVLIHSDKKKKLF